ncbi:MAG: DUF5819 family protein [Actinomycetota bacterium]|nr:DUF5819 family protein [Actinomycetota bacterium]
MPGSDQKSDKSPRPWQKGLLLVIGLLAVAHTLLVATWLAPTSPIRDALGQTRLATYVDPYFQQSWSAIDPNSQYVDETLRFRAQVLDVDAGTTKTTGWIDLTAMEDRFLKFDVQPARVHLINRRLATNLNSATFALNTKQRSLVDEDYVKIPVARLATRLDDVGFSPPVVRNYMAYDQMAVQFLSMYAAAQTGDEVLTVQYKVGRRTVPPFKDRDTAELRGKKFTYFTYGWRQAYAGQLDAQSAFDSYVGK